MEESINGLARTTQSLGNFNDGNALQPPPYCLSLSFWQSLDGVFKVGNLFSSQHRLFRALFRYWQIFLAFLHQRLQRLYGFQATALLSAQIDDNAVYPSSEASRRLPTGSGSNDPKEGVLGDILRFLPIADNLRR